MRSAFDWFFRNRSTGEITIAQWPNWPLVVFFACYAIDFALSPGGFVGAALRFAETAGITIWAADEILRGVNPWRRCLGGAVLLALAYRAIA